MDMEALAGAIRAARKDAGLTQKDLAELAGVSERTLRDLERGVGNPSFAAVVGIVNVLGLRMVVE